MKKIYAFLGCLLIITISVFSGCINQDGDIEIKQFTASPDVINQGETVTLQWIVTGATTVKIDHTIGDVNPIGNTTLVLNETTTFTLTATNENETKTAAVMVYVTPSDQIDSIIIDNEAFEEASRDAFDIKNVFLYQDVLEITVGYSGGCKNHRFTLISKENFMESDPVQIDVVLSHDAKNDPCDAYLTETLAFNLSALKEKWQNEYQMESGTIVMLLENYTEAIRYTFGEDQFSFLHVTIQTNQDVYGINETIQVMILVENLKNESVTLEFPDSQVGDFHCKNSKGDIVYLWSKDRGFAEVITPVTIPAETTSELFEFNWSRMSNEGEVLDDGVYTLRGWIPRFYYQDENYDYSTTLGPPVYSDPIQITFV